MAKSVAILSGESARIDRSAGYALSASSEVTRSSLASAGLCLRSIRLFIKIACGSIVLFLAGIYVYACLRYWKLTLVVLVAGVGLFLVCHFVDDYESQPEHPDTRQ